MRMPWTRTEEEKQEVNQRAKEARGHLRIILLNLNDTLTRIESKYGGSAPDDG